MIPPPTEQQVGGGASLQIATPTTTTLQIVTPTTTTLQIAAPQPSILQNITTAVIEGTREFISELQITPTNVTDTLSQIVSRGETVIDLVTNPVGTILKNVVRNSLVSYLNTFEQETLPTEDRETITNIYTDIIDQQMQNTNIINNQVQQDNIRTTLNTLRDRLGETNLTGQDYIDILKELEEIQKDFTNRMTTSNTNLGNLGRQLTSARERIQMFIDVHDIFNQLETDRTRSNLLNDPSENFETLLNILIFNTAPFDRPRGFNMLLEALSIEHQMTSDTNIRNTIQAQIDFINNDINNLTLRTDENIRHYFNMLTETTTRFMRGTDTIDSYDFVQEQPFILNDNNTDNFREDSLFQIFTLENLIRVDVQDGIITENLNSFVFNENRQTIQKNKEQSNRTKEKQEINLIRQYIIDFDDIIELVVKEKQREYMLKELDYLSKVKFGKREN